jgi:2-amino-4-hydroxy-6-hydroxymethyldihydropteridine diphosphokinase
MARRRAARVPEAGPATASMRRVFVAAGSNVDAARNLALAARELRRTFPDVQFSPAYRNAAVGFEGEDFINFVAGFDSDRGRRGVVAQLQRIEALCGRERDAPKWAPRSMDLDLLLYGDEVCDEPGLVLPRGDLVRRPYMLGPMADLAPQVRHPTLGLTLGELWQRFDRAAHAMQRVELDLGEPAR